MSNEITVRNPYTPSAGARPPLLTGRSDIKEDLSTIMRRLKQGQGYPGLMIQGLRGVGKTAMLNSLHEMVLEYGNGFIPIVMEVEPGGDVIDSLVGEMDVALDDHVPSLGKPNQLKAALNDLGVVAGRHVGSKSTGTTMKGTLSVQLKAVARELKQMDLAFLIFIDEAHALDITQLERLTYVVHTCQRDNLPLVFSVAGLPSLAPQLAKARSNSERLFVKCSISKLNSEQARSALAIPAMRMNRRFTPEALEEILLMTKGYPFHLQVWGSHAWDEAKSDTITLEDVRNVADKALDRIMGMQHVSRSGEMTAMQREYSLALASLPAGERTHANVATKLGRTTKSLSHVRKALVDSGIIHEPLPGSLDFSLPMFDELLLKRNGQPAADDG